jgi:glycosyltransferase involved in cell wall biosynthesis
MTGTSTVVDVVVPVFNDQVRLLLLLEALGRQTLPATAFRVTVVDNGSIPAIRLPAVPFACEPLHCARPGSYAARNAAWPRTKAAWVAFTDSDCLPEPDWLERGLAATRTMDADGDAPRLLAGAITMVPSRPEAPTAADLLELHFGMQQEHYVSAGGFGITANLWVERQLLEQLQGFDATRKSGADRDFCLRARAAGFRVRYVPDCRISHPARSCRELTAKARRLIGGRVDGAGSGLPCRLLALALHTKPLLREGWVTLRLPLPMRDRWSILRLQLVLRAVAAREWVALVFGGKDSLR